MIPELERRVSEFEDARHELHDLVSGIDDRLFNRRPDKRRWSMAECVDHLLVVGWKMAPRLDAALIDARARGWHAEGPFRYGGLGDWFVRQSGADELPPKRALKTPRLYTPRQQAEWRIPQALEEFTNLQDKLTSLAASADGLDLARIKIASPVTRLLRLSYGQWLALLSGHQKRHLWQAAQAKTVVSGSQGL